MRRKLLTWMGVWLLGALPGAAFAADHNDGPMALANKDADIADVYAWMDSGGQKVNLVLDWFPDVAADHQLSDAVQFAFHLSSMPAYGGAAKEMLAVCTFDAAEKISCWVGDDEYVTGDARSEAGLVSTSGKVRVF